MTQRIGLDAKLYYNSATYASPTWVEIDDAQDVTLTIEASEGEVKRRASTFTEYIAALKDASIEFDLVNDASSSVQTALSNAFFNRTAIEVLALDGDVEDTGSEGLRMTCAVTNWSRNEPLEEVLTRSVTLRPTPNEDAVPEAVTIPLD